MNTSTQTTNQQAGQWSLDSAHSSANFSIKHMMIAKVRGGFEKLSADLTFDPKNLGAARVEATIDTASINTREPERDKHLRSADFFDVEKFPQIRFASTKFEPSSSGLKITGDLTIHGITQSVVLDVEGPSETLKDPWGQLKMGATARTKIQRKDFGLTWNAALETGGILVGDDVSIELELQFVKKA